MRIGEYGILITLLALLEILYLVSGFGLSFLVQRYVPEYRLLLTHSAFRRALLALLLRRFVYSILAVSVFWFAARPVFGLLDIETAQTLLTVYLILVLAGCQIRFFDELFPTLLLQGYAQVILLIRNVVKLVGVVYAYVFLQELSLENALYLELFALLIALVVAMALLASYTTNTGGESGEATSFSIAPNAKKGALRYFFAQIMGQIYSANAVKLVISSALGSSAVAVYGFAQSLTDMLGNYQPATLLAGWIRPVVVSRYVQHRDANASLEMLGVLFKTGFVALAPAIALLLVFGDVGGAWLSKGKFEHSGLLLAGLAAVVVLQGLHQLLGIAIVAFDQTKIIFRATLLCGLLSVVLSQLITAIGLYGAVCWLIGTELTWIFFVSWSLVSGGFWSSSVKSSPFFKLIGVAFAVFCAAMLIREFVMPSVLFTLGICVFLFFISTMAGLLSRIYTASELRLFEKIFPARFLRVLGTI
jgi:O-antigen/teichoic acid export membrane protein